MGRSHRHTGSVRRAGVSIDPYGVLSVPRSADQAAIRRAYLDLVRQHPPERDPDTFKRVRAAYEMLGTPEARATALVEIPEPPPGEGLTVSDGPAVPAIAGIPLGFLLAFDPFSDLPRRKESEQ
jgi:curved DNA-binding protein CbpA